MIICEKKNDICKKKKNNNNIIPITSPTITTAPFSISHTPPFNPKWKPVAIINFRYAMGPKIGAGSFGSVHAGVDLKDNYRFIAIKLEPLKPRHHPQLEREYKMYCEMHSKNLGNSAEHNLIGIPHIYHFGSISGHPFNALVMDMLGPSLEKLFNECNRKFSLKTVLMLADQMLCRLEFIHDAGYLHRDLKPDNFLMGIYNSERVVYVVDLGLGKCYIDHSTNTHMPYQEGKTLTGTARYASVNTHLGVEQSRRDDLESLGYIFMYFLRGRLPWQGIKAATRHDKYEKIARKKLSTLPENLCKGYPPEFAHMIRYSWRLGYDERPNYEKLRRMFREVFFKLNYTADWQYDWDLKGKSPTQMALENHPFIRGNKPIPKSSHRGKQKRRSSNNVNHNNKNSGAVVTGNDDDTKETDYVKQWGGEKHRSGGNNYSKNSKRTSQRRGAAGNIAVKASKTHHKLKHTKDKASVSVIRQSRNNVRTVSQSQTPQRYHHSSSKMYNNSGNCLPILNAQNDESGQYKAKENKRSLLNFACFQSQSPKPLPNRVNTEPATTSRKRQSMTYVSTTSTSRNKQTAKTQHRRSMVYLPRSSQSRRNNNSNHSSKAHHTGQHNQSRHDHNNHQSPHMVRLPQQSISYTSSPSPIVQKRRFSDNFAGIKHRNNNNSVTPLPPPKYQNIVQSQSARAHRSQSQRMNNTRRSVILNPHSHSRQASVSSNYYNTASISPNPTDMYRAHWYPTNSTHRSHTPAHTPAHNPLQLVTPPRHTQAMHLRSHTQPQLGQAHTQLGHSPMGHVPVSQQPSVEFYVSQQKLHALQQQQRYLHQRQYEIQQQCRHVTSQVNNNSNNNNDGNMGGGGNMGTWAVAYDKQEECAVQVAGGAVTEAVTVAAVTVPLKILRGSKSSFGSHSPRSQKSAVTPNSAKSHRSSRIDRDILKSPHTSFSHRTLRSIPSITSKTSKASISSSMFVNNPTHSVNNESRSAGEAKGGLAQLSRVSVSECQSPMLANANASVIHEMQINNENVATLEVIHQMSQLNLTGRSSTLPSDAKERKNSTSTSQAVCTEEQREYSYTETTGFNRTTPKSYTNVAFPNNPFHHNTSKSSNSNTNTITMSSGPSEFIKNQIIIENPILELDEPK